MTSRSAPRKVLPLYQGRSIGRRIVMDRSEKVHQTSVCQIKRFHKQKVLPGAEF